MRLQRTLDLLKDKNFESVVLCGSCGAQEDQYYDELIDAGYIDELDARVAGSRWPALTDVASCSSPHLRD